MSDTFTVPVTTEVTVKARWAAIILPVWSGEDEPERVSDIDTYVVEVSPETVKVVGGAVCVALEGDTGFIPCDAGQWATDSPARYDDTHDLRSRLFDTKVEAEEHIKFTENRFAHPQVWESFVQV